jgi:hypothetical protein
MYRNEKNAFKETQVCKAFKLFILKQKKIFDNKIIIESIITSIYLHEITIEFLLYK